VVRQDTGEIVRTRPMNPEELQRDLFDRKRRGKKGKLLALDGAGEKPTDPKGDAPTDGPASP